MLPEMGGSVEPLSKLPGMSLNEEPKSLLAFVLWLSPVRNYELVPHFQELYLSLFIRHLPSS